MDDQQQKKYDVREIMQQRAVLSHKPTKERNHTKHNSNDTIAGHTGSVSGLGVYPLLCRWCGHGYMKGSSSVQRKKNEKDAC